MNDRPALPAATERYVRQRCAFGCVLCGIPFYHYDHVTNWSETGQHNPDDIALLCAIHHDQKTRGHITSTMVEDGLRNPFNSQKANTTPFELYVTAGPLAVRFGSFLFTYDNVPEEVPIFPFFLDDLPIVSFVRQDERLLFSIQLFDVNNLPVLIVQNNELILATDHWDIEYVGRTITIRSAPRELLVTLTIDPSGSIEFGRGRILANGIECELWADSVALINNRNIYGGPGTIQINGAQFGVVFGRKPQLDAPFAMIFADIPRYDVDFAENRRIVHARRRGSAE